MTAAGTKPRRRKRREREERLSVLGTAPEERLATTQRLAAALEAESLLAQPHARRALAEALAVGVVHLDTLIAQRDAGRLTGEEARSIPALISNIRRLAETAGVTQQLNPDDCRECVGTGRRGDDDCTACAGTGAKES